MYNNAYEFVTGSEDLQCDASGQCQCKPGVSGQQCDRCEENFYDFGIYGCRWVCEHRDNIYIQNSPVL